MCSFGNACKCWSTAFFSIVSFRRQIRCLPDGCWYSCRCYIRWNATWTIYHLRKSYRWFRWFWPMQTVTELYWTPWYRRLHTKDCLVVRRYCVRHLNHWVPHDVMLGAGVREAKPYNKITGIPFNPTTKYRMVWLSWCGRTEFQACGVSMLLFYLLKMIS